MKIVQRVDSVIRTERLVLRPLRESDVVAIFPQFNDCDVVRWLSEPPWPYGLEDCRAYVRRTLARARSDPATTLAITRDDFLVGMISLRLRDAGAAQHGGDPVIGY